MDEPLTRSQTSVSERPRVPHNYALTRFRSTPDTALQRIFSFSPQFMDDHGAHHYRSRSNSNEKEVEPVSPDLEKQDSEEVDEVRFGIRNEHDFPSNESTIGDSKSIRSEHDPYLVTWNGEDDPESPKNWSLKQKWIATFIVSSFTFMSPVSSSMVAPALQDIGKDIGITTELELSMILSIFILAYAIGPLFLGPLSEIYGRAIVLQVTNLVYLAFNLGCGFAQTKEQMIAFRFFAGLGGSAPLALGGGLLSDCFRAEERGKAIAIYSLAPLLGPAVGPIAGGFISMKTTWRWVFWATSIADFGIQVLGLFFLRETYAPKLLQTKAKRLRKETGNPAWHTEYDSPDRTLAKVLATNLIRPFRLLSTQPIVQVIALYLAYLYGMMYLVLSTFPEVWSNSYHESIGIGGLNYISLGIGFFLGTQICAPINDRIYRKLKKRNNNTGKPEFRIPLMNIGALLTPAGLFIYGWTSYFKTHWIGPNIGAAIFAAGIIIGFQCSQTYLVDAYTRYAASAVASATVLRSLCGFAFPLFAPYMYQSLGLGWGNSLLGFVGIVLGVPAPILIWKFGQTLREKSTFAAG